jgi:uncharacterized protein with GYD domain
MATYISLCSFTDQGIRTMRDLNRRLQNADQTYASFGAQLKEIYLVMGPYDYIVISEAPNDESAARVALAVAGQGNVRTQTLRAFARQELLKLVEGLA